jgi:hypothetical protein
MRPQALALATVFLLMPLAGCLGGSMATAKDLIPEARRIAQEWSPDAALQGVVGIELREIPLALKAALASSKVAEATADNPELQLMKYRDGDVGDGRTGAWLFAFGSDGNELVLVLDASGKEIIRHEASARGHDLAALGDVAIDSDQAADIASKSNAKYGELRGHSAAGFMTLAATPQGPFWVLMLLKSFDLGLDDTSVQEDDEGSAMVMVVVDAMNGTVMDEGMDDLFDAQDSGSRPAVPSSGYYRPRANHTFVPTEEGADSDTLMVGAGDKESSFTLASAGHATLRLQFDLPRALPATAATATVTGPDGRVQKMSFASTAGVRSPEHATIDAPVAGEYKVVVRLDSGITQDYDFSWCAPGSRMASSAADTQSACGEA